MKIKMKKLINKPIIFFITACMLLSFFSCTKNLSIDSSEQESKEKLFKMLGIKESHLKHSTNTEKVDTAFKNFSDAYNYFSKMRGVNEKANQIILTAKTTKSKSQSFSSGLNSSSDSVKQQNGSYEVIDYSEINF